MSSLKCSAHHAPRGPRLRGQNISAISCTQDASANCIIHRDWDPPSERRLKSPLTELMMPPGDYVAMATCHRGKNERQVNMKERANAREKPTGNIKETSDQQATVNKVGGVYLCH